MNSGTAVGMAVPEFILSLRGGPKIFSQNSTEKVRYGIVSVITVLYVIVWISKLSSYETGDRILAYQIIPLENGTEAPSLVLESLGGLQLQGAAVLGVVISMTCPSCQSARHAIQGCMLAAEERGVARAVFLLGEGSFEGRDWGIHPATKVVELPPGVVLTELPSLLLIQPDGSMLIEGIHGVEIEYGYSLAKRLLSD